MINTVFAQETADGAREQWRAVAAQLGEKFPKLEKYLDDAENDVLAFMDFPKAHRKQIASTNPLERLNAEIKRRTDGVGIFPNDPRSCASLARCCSNKTTSGNCSAATCNSKHSKPSATIRSTGSQLWLLAENPTVRRKSLVHHFAGHDQAYTYAFRLC